MKYMKHTFENETIKLFLEGELNSSNADDIEKEIDSILGKYNFNNIVFDLEKLHYISSAGLRIIIRLKKLHTNVSLIKVTSEIYGIFEMVGFTNILDIEKL